MIQYSQKRKIPLVCPALACSPLYSRPDPWYIYPCYHLVHPEHFRWPVIIIQEYISFWLLYLNKNKNLHHKFANYTDSYENPDYVYLLSGCAKHFIVIILGTVRICNICPIIMLTLQSYCKTVRIIISLLQWGKLRLGGNGLSKTTLWAHGRG